jgi:steroid delta-isomerase
MPSPEQVRAAIDGYVRSFVDKDKQAFLDGLAEAVTQEDPVGSPVNTGKDALGAFFDGLFEVCESIEFDARETYVSADTAALVFTIVQHKKDGSTATIDGVDVFTVDDDGKVASVRGLGALRA